MLVLKRRENEAIRIGGDIVVTVVEISGKQVRLGIVAPKDVRIMRTELLGEESNEQRTSD